MASKKTFKPGKKVDAKTADSAKAEERKHQSPLKSAVQTAGAVAAGLMGPSFINSIIDFSKETVNAEKKKKDEDKSTFHQAMSQLYQHPGRHRDAHNKIRQLQVLLNRDEDETFMHHAAAVGDTLEDSMMALVTIADQGTPEQMKQYLIDQQYIGDKAEFTFSQTFRRNANNIGEDVLTALHRHESEWRDVEQPRVRVQARRVGRLSNFLARFGL